VPAVLDTRVYDEVVRVTNEEAMATTRRLAREEGVFVGISSGSVVFAALQIAGRPAMKDRRIVAVLASFGERYLSHPVFTELPEPDTTGFEQALA
jgi:cysteine synthase